MPDLEDKKTSLIPDLPGWLSTARLVIGCLAIFLLAAEAAGGDAKAEGGGPREHFSVDNPAELSDAEAEAIYRRLSEAMRNGYRLSDHPVAWAYQSWSRFNTAPYRSATHGERFVNNYANGIGRAYGSFEQAGDLPVGSIVAKDSFAVTAAGEVTPGPLFIMEKMPPGFDATSRDWRYSMIMPDGSLFGVTKGVDSQNVRFCNSCHERAGAQSDHLYFVQQAYR